MTDVRVKRAARARVAGAFLLVLVAALLVSGLVLQQIVAHGDYPFDIDEANHANGALAQLLAARAGGAAGLLRAFMQQGFYPPAFALVQSVAFAVFRPSPTVARAASALAFFFAVLLIFALCLQIDKRYGWLAGLVACGATLTSAPLLENAGLVMKETPGLLVSFLFLWAYTRALQRATARRLALSSGLLLFLFLTKYTYGLAALAALLLLELSLLLWPVGGAVAGEAAAYEPRAAWRRYAWLLGPFLIGIVIWFAYPGNMGLFLDYVTAQPQGASMRPGQGLLFYVASIVTLQTPAPSFALLTAASLLWALWRWRQPATRLLFLTFVVGLGMMAVNRPLNPRFIATFVPAAHVLSGLLLARLAAGLTADGRMGRRRPALLAAAALSAAFIALSLPGAVQRLQQYPARMHVAYETDPALEDMAQWIVAQAPPGERFYVVNYWDQFGPQTLAWYLGRGAASQGEGSRDTNFSDLLMPGALLEPASPQNVQALRQDVLRSGVSHLVLLEGSPWGAPFWPDYTAALANILQPVAEETFVIARPAGGAFEVKVLVWSVEISD